MQAIYFRMLTHSCVYIHRPTYNWHFQYRQLSYHLPASIHPLVESACASSVAGRLPPKTFLTRALSYVILLSLTRVESQRSQWRGQCGESNFAWLPAHLTSHQSIVMSVEVNSFVPRYQPSCIHGNAIGWAQLRQIEK